MKREPRIITVKKLRDISLFNNETTKRGTKEARTTRIIFLLIGTKDRKYLIWAK